MSFLISGPGWLGAGPDPDQSQIWERSAPAAARRIRLIDNEWASINRWSARPWPVSRTKRELWRKLDALLSWGTVSKTVSIVIIWRIGVTNVIITDHVMPPGNIPRYLLTNVRVWELADDASPDQAPAPAPMILYSLLSPLIWSLGQLTRGGGGPALINVTCYPASGSVFKHKMDKHVTIKLRNDDRCCINPFRDPPPNMGPRIEMLDFLWNFCFSLLVPASGRCIWTKSGIFFLQETFVMLSSCFQLKSLIEIRKYVWDWSWETLRGRKLSRI